MLSPLTGFIDVLCSSIPRYSVGGARTFERPLEIAPWFERPLKDLSMHAATCLVHQERASAGSPALSCTAGTDPVGGAAPEIGGATALGNEGAAEIRGP